MKLTPAKLEGSATMREFALAGCATFTVRNLWTARHYTYKVQRAPGRASPRIGQSDARPNLWFVQVLSGTGYLYVGTLKGDPGVTGKPVFAWGTKSPLPTNALCVRGFDWVWKRVARGELLPPKVEVWHEGRCGRCGRPLTDPDSIRRGIGPVCGA